MASVDLFHAIAEPRRRQILDVLAGGEKAVGAIVNDVAIPQPQVSKHLRVLSDAGLVVSRADGRRRLYRVEPAGLHPFRDWLAEVERMMTARFDRVDDYLEALQRQGEPK